MRYEDSMFGAPMDGFGDAMFYLAVGAIVIPLVVCAVLLVGEWLLGWK